MRKLLIATVLFGACGIQPTIQPWGCNGTWICICDENRDCQWHLICEN